MCLIRGLVTVIVSLPLSLIWVEAAPAETKHPAETKGVKALTGNFETELKFVNKSGVTVKIYWIDYEGQRKLYSTLKRGETYEQKKAYLTHPWLVTDNSDNAWYIYYPDAQPRTIDVVAPPKGALKPREQPLEYAQSAEELGIGIKAPATVDKKALEAAKVIIKEMLENARPDVRERLVARKAALGIVPKDRFVTALPEFARLSGGKDVNDNEYDSFKVRGLGAVIGQPVSAVSEESLLRLNNDPFKGMSVTHHEFGHAVMNLGFSEADHVRWKAIYHNAAAKKLLKDNGGSGRFAMGNADEYWAVLTTAYFSVNWDELSGPDVIREKDPDAFKFIELVYGPSPKRDAKHVERK